MGQFWPPVPVDTGWVTPTLATGWTAVTGEAPGYRLIGRTLSFRGRANSTGATQYAFTLPSAFWPELQVVGQTEAGGSPMRCIVTTSGGVGQAAAAAASGFSFGGFPQIIPR